jgi:hypothetical protein
MGRIDRIARIAVAVFIAIMMLAGGVSGIGIVIVGIIAAYLLITGIVGTCLIYNLLKASTIKKA